MHVCLVFQIYLYMVKGVHNSSLIISDVARIECVMMGSLVQVESELFIFGLSQICTHGKDCGFFCSVIVYGGQGIDIFSFLTKMRMTGKRYVH